MVIMKLLLMSSTYTNEKLKNTFLNLLTKPIHENRTLIIHQTISYYDPKTFDYVIYLLSEKLG